MFVVGSNTDSKKKASKKPPSSLQATLTTPTARLLQRSPKTGRMIAKFEWTASSAADIPKRVFVTGEFNNWSRPIELIKEKTGSIFSALVVLPEACPGEKIQYKFIVDGVWKTSLSKPIQDDGHGNKNNVFMIEDSSTVSPYQSIKSAQADGYINEDTKSISAVALIRPLPDWSKQASTYVSIKSHLKALDIILERIAKRRNSVNEETNVIQNFVVGAVSQMHNHFSNFFVSESNRITQVLDEISGMIEIQSTTSLVLDNSSMAAFRDRMVHSTRIDYSHLKPFDQSCDLDVSETLLKIPQVDKIRIKYGTINDSSEALYKKYIEQIAQRIANELFTAFTEYSEQSDLQLNVEVSDPILLGALRTMRNDNYGTIPANGDYYYKNNKHAYNEDAETIFTHTESKYKICKCNIDTVELDHYEKIVRKIIKPMRTCSKFWHPTLFLLQLDILPPTIRFNVKVFLDNTPKSTSSGVHPDDLELLLSKIKTNM
ncbi:hypothetical protein HK100_006775, partial [Physocladia obscura]